MNRANQINTKALLNFGNLSTKDCEHLQKVYGVLALTVACCVASTALAPVVIFRNFFMQIMVLVLSIFLIIKIRSSESN